MFLKLKKKKTTVLLCIRENSATYYREDEIGKTEKYKNICSEHLLYIHETVHIYTRKHLALTAEESPLKNWTPRLGGGIGKSQPSNLKSKMVSSPTHTSGAHSWTSWSLVTH